MVTLPIGKSCVIWLHVQGWRNEVSRQLQLPQQQVVFMQQLCYNVIEEIMTASFRLIS